MKILNRVEEVFISITLVFATVLVFVNVVMRFFGFGLTWSEELIRYLIIWMTFIGLSVAVREGSHMTIEMLPDYLKGKKKYLLTLSIYTIGIVFSIMLTWFGIQFVNFSYGTGQLSSALNISFYMVYIVLPISGLLILIRYIDRLIHLIRRKEVV